VCNSSSSRVVTSEFRNFEGAVKYPDHLLVDSVCFDRYVLSYIPGGQTGLKFFTKIFYAAASKTVQKTLPV